MEIESEQCLSLVKRYNQLYSGEGHVHPGIDRIKQILSVRINNGIAQQNLFLFLNRLTNNAVTVRPYFLQKKTIYPEKLQHLYQLYEFLIDSSDTSKSVSYLIQALNSVSSMRGELRYEFRKELVSEDTKEEHGPDHCGHINTRIYHYRTYRVERHYKKRRPLVEKARSRLVTIVGHMGLTQSDEKDRVYRVLRKSRENELAGRFGLEITNGENKILHDVEYIGDHGYW